MGGASLQDGLFAGAQQDVFQAFAAASEVRQGEIRAVLRRAEGGAGGKEAGFCSFPAQFVFKAGQGLRLHLAKAFEKAFAQGSRSVRFTEKGVEAKGSCGGFFESKPAKSALALGGAKAFEKP